MITNSSKVLIVDDFSLARILMSEALKALGMNDQVQAKDGQDAFNIIEKCYSEKNPISLIFLDWAMPIMNGFEVLKKCRADERFSTVPIVMVTAEAERSNLLKAISAGANAYIVKPITREALSEKIGEINLKINLKKGS